MLFSPNLNSVQLKCKWLDGHNYLYKARGCGTMGDKISVYEHRKGTQSNVRICTPLAIKHSVLYSLWNCFSEWSYFENNFRLEQTHWISTWLCFYIHISSTVKMYTIAAVSNVFDDLGEQGPVEVVDQITDERRSEFQRWTYCCRLRNGIRWPLLSHLWSIGFHRKKCGYVDLTRPLPMMDLLAYTLENIWSILSWARYSK